MKRAHLASGSSPPPPARSCSALRQPPPSGDRNLASPRPQGSREMSWFPSRQQHHDTRLFLGRCPQGTSWINVEFRKLLPVTFDFKNPNERQTSCGGWRPLAGHLEMISGGHGSQSCSRGHTKAPWARGQTQPRLSAIDLQAGPFPPPRAPLGPLVSLLPVHRVRHPSTLPRRRSWTRLSPVTGLCGRPRASGSVPEPWVQSRGRKQPTLSLQTRVP